MPESRDEREVTADMELHTPSWLPGLKLGLSYRRLWDKRARGFLQETAEMANIDEETLVDRINEGDGFADIFQNAAERAVRDGDPVVHSTLKRLIASALQDDSHILEVSYILGILEKFQPIHIRIIATLPSLASDSINTLELSETVKAEFSLVASALGELAATQLVIIGQPKRGSEYREISLGALGNSLVWLINEIDSCD